MSLQSAAAALAATMSPQIHPSGFRISDTPVAGSFANPDSFQQVQDVMLRDEACIQSSLSLGGAEGSWVRYWDDSSTVAVLEFAVAAPVRSSSAKDKKDKKKKGHIGAHRSKLFINTIFQKLRLYDPSKHQRPQSCSFLTNLSHSASAKVAIRLLVSCIQNHCKA
jgi:hypothetical protein